MSKGNRKRRRELGLLPEPARCIARSKRTGTPCKNAPLEGSVVCRWHGGAAPQVVRKAQERIALAQDDAATLLVRWMQDEAVPFAERRKCAEALLNRGGNSPGQRLEILVDTLPWQQIIDGIVSEVEDDQVSRVTRLISGDAETDDPSIIDAEVVDTGEGELPDPTPLPTPAAQPRIPSRRRRR